MRLMKFTVLLAGATLMMNVGCASKNKRENAQASQETQQTDQSAKSQSASESSPGDQASAQASGSQASGQQSAGQQSSGQGSQPQQVAGFVFIPEGEFLDLQRLPLAFMTEARKDFQAKNYGESASDIEAAANMLRTRAKNEPEGQAKNELMTAVLNLDRLAPQVRQVRLKNEGQLTALFADFAYHAGLAYRLRAQEQFQSNQYKLAGYDVAMATAFLDQGMQWAGKQADQQRLSQIRNVAAQLITGTGWDQQQVNQGMNTLASGIENLGQSLASVSVNPSRAGRGQQGAQQETQGTTGREPSSIQSGGSHPSGATSESGMSHDTNAAPENSNSNLPGNSQSPSDSGGDSGSSDSSWE